MRKTTVSKSEFIRSLPADMKVSEVIAKGKEAKLKITPSLVYGVRTAQNKVKVVKVANGNGDGMHKAESALLAVAGEIGLGRAIELLSTQREVVSKLLS